MYTPDSPANAPPSPMEGRSEADAGIEIKQPRGVNPKGKVLNVPPQGRIHLQGKGQVVGPKADGTQLEEALLQVLLLLVEELPLVLSNKIGKGAVESGLMNRKDARVHGTQQLKELLRQLLIQIQ